MELDVAEHEASHGAALLVLGDAHVQSITRLPDRARSVAGEVHGVAHDGFGLFRRAVATMMPMAEANRIPPWPPAPDWHPESDVSMLAKYVDAGLTEAAYELAIRETEYLMGDPTYRRLKAVLTAMLDEHGTLDLVDVALCEVAVRNRLADERRGERDELGVLNDWGLSVDEVRAVTPQLNQLAYPGAAPMLKAIANLFGRRRH